MKMSLNKPNSIQESDEENETSPMEEEEQEEETKIISKRNYKKRAE